MLTCPFCNSENTYYSKKRCVWVCEDCDKTFVETDIPQPASSVSDKGLKLFFSYGHDRNRLLVDRIKKDLEARGHHVWIDTDKIRPGDHWREDIVNGVLNSAKIIAFLSEHSTRKPGVCLDELKIAVCVKGANIKTVLLESENLIQPPSTISDIQWLDMSEWYDIKNSHAKDYEEWYKKKFEELCEVIESDNSKELNGEVHWLKEILHPYLNTDKEHGLLAKEFYGRQWLNDYIENWQDRTTSKSLIIYGKPGSGKSAFCVNYSHYNSDVYGCFLCEWNRTQTINPCDLIRTMAFRLATKLSDYRQLLLHLLNNNDRSLNEMNPEDLFEYLLAYPLNNLVDGDRETGIVIVDGLDEAESNGKNILAEVFAMCIQKLPQWIRFIFTSRPEKNILTTFQSSQSVDIISDMPTGYNDVLNYLMNSLKCELLQLPNKLEILNAICERSEGIFLYAAFLVEGIKNNSISINDVESFPKGLNGFYLSSMKRKFNAESFKSIRSLIELLCVTDNIPEYIIKGVCNYSQYDLFERIDRIGSWISCTENMGISSVSFCHKSIKDWFANPAQSEVFYVDSKHGALELARYCANHLDDNYAINNIGNFYILSEAYEELELFLLHQKEELYPFWSVWKQFPDNWNHQVLLDAFWASSTRNNYLVKLQREGATELILWIFDKAKEKYGIENFDRELISVYIDIVHLSGEYSKAVEIINNYLDKITIDEIESDKFLSMLRVRKIHHQMYYTPVEKLLGDAFSLLSTMDKKFPDVYNELLFLIGGNLSVLAGKWELAKKWLKVSEDYAKEHRFIDNQKRNSRKLADCLCYEDELDNAKETVNKYVSEKGEITGRYEAYLVGALGNIYTCLSYEDEALECFKKLLEYTTAKGIISWAAHANLGISNVYFKLSNIKEAAEYANRANLTYKKIHEEWGIVMSEAILAACQSKLGTAPLDKACEKAIKRAQLMQYNACISSIEDVCKGKRNYFKLYFL